MNEETMNEEQTMDGETVMDEEGARAAYAHDLAQNAPPLHLFTPDRSALSEDGLLYLQAFCKAAQGSLANVKKHFGNQDSYALDTFKAISDACVFMIAGGSPGEVPQDILKHFDAVEHFLEKSRAIAIEQLARRMVTAVLDCGPPDLKAVPILDGTYTHALEIGVGEDAAKGSKKKEDRKKGIAAEDKKGNLIKEHRYLIGQGDKAMPANLVISSRGKKRITVYVKAMMEEKSPFADLVSEGRLLKSQLLIYYIVCGLYDYYTELGIEKPIFWAERIYSLLPGGKQSPRAKDLQAIDEIISMFRDLKFTVDLADEYKLKAFQESFGPEMLDPEMTGTVLANLPLLSLDDVVLPMKNGSVIHGYRLNDMPLLYRLDGVKGQVTTIKRADYCGYPLDMTKGRKVLIVTLLERIEKIRREWRKLKETRRYEERRKPENKGKPLSELPAPAFSELSRTYKFIKWDTLFSDAGITSQNRSTQKRNRDFCLAVLAGLKSRGRIKDYRAENKSTTDEGKGSSRGPKAKATGVLIILDD